MSERVNAKLHFMDGTSISLKWRRQETNPAMVASQLRKALEMDKLAVEVHGDLLVIPIRNVKYLQMSPAPETLPNDVVKGASIGE